jgi:pimeloyl-ACP methyl ester carboxylesterase
MRQPETKYVSVGRDRVAYQVFGEGERDLLFLGPPWLSVDAVWENVGHLRIWRLASEQFRCVGLDHRGFGMSDTIPESRLGDPVVCVEDALAVLDAVGMERVCVFGEGWGGYSALQLVVDHADRVDRLALVNADAKRSRGDGYEFGEPVENIASTSELKSRARSED